MPKIVKECGNLEDFFMSVRFNEGIGYTVQELVNDEEGIVSIPLVDTHHESIIAIAYEMNSKDELLKELVSKIEYYFEDKMPLQMVLLLLFDMLLFLCYHLK